MALLKNMDVTDPSHSPPNVLTPLRGSLEMLAGALAAGSGQPLLDSLLRVAVQLSGAQYGFVGRLDEGATEATVAVSYPPELGESAWTYALRDTPCRDVARDGICIVPRNVQAAYPRDSFLAEYGAHAYAGRCLLDSSGGKIGLLTLINHVEFNDVASLGWILDIIGSSISYELVRERRERELRENRARLDLIISNSQQGFWDWDLATNRLTSLSLDSERPANNAPQKNPWPMFEPDDRRLLRRALIAYLRGLAPNFEEEVRVRDATGGIRWILIRGKLAERAVDGKPRRLMGTHIDVTSMKSAELALEQARLLLSTVLDNIPQAVYWKDRDSHYLGCNQTFAKLAGVEHPRAIVGLTDDDLPWRALAGRLRIEDLAILDGEQRHIVTEDCVTNSRGTEIWVEKHKVPLCAHDGSIKGVLGTTHDVTERKRAAQEIERLAFYDGLTQLPNRRYFKDRLTAALASAKRHASAGALLYLDLDHFKRVNDSLGHASGDRLLLEASARIKRVLRTEDVVARIGGDEFAILLGDLSMDTKYCAQQAKIVAHKLLDTLAQPFAFESDDLYLTSTIGIAVFPEHHQDADELMKMADAAMYRGKLAGRNTAFFFDPELLAEAEARLRIETLLRGAIERGELALHYQPQVDSEGRLLGAEALMRWRNPTLGQVSPAVFISVAEETGLIDELGLWAIKEALTALARWYAEGVPCGSHLSVNVSQRQFASPRFVADVTAELRKHAVPRGALVLELTESAAAERVEDTIMKMEQLRAAGLSFSIDDFGVGYSSLSYLARLPLQQLKIDRSFIPTTEDDRTRTAIIATLMALGENLGIDVVAEGVETVAQWEMLIVRGCRAFQGFLFSRALAEVDFVGFCKASERGEDLVQTMRRKRA